MSIDVETVELPDQPALCVRFRTSMEKVADDIGRAYGVIYAHLGKVGGVPAGPPLALYYDMEMNPEDFDMETCAPVVSGAAGEGEVEFRVLPGGKFLQTMHRGPYDTLGSTCEALFGYAKENGLEVVAPAREVYLNDPSQVERPEDILTQILFPL